MKHAAYESIIDPNRLFAAADAILGAFHSPLGESARISMHMGPRRAGGTLPATVFTNDELIEAMAMLIRMGLVPLPMSRQDQAPPAQEKPS